MFETKTGFGTGFFPRCAAALAAISLLAGCSSLMKMTKDPFYKSFYEKTQLIMTREEAEIYKRLPDKASKEEFIKEFWDIRDPDPGTVENENKEEFEDRVEYANTWFGVWNPRRGRLEIKDEDKYRGWDSDRGRIYIILGPPDDMVYDGGELFKDRMLSRPGGRRFEQWYYFRFRLVVNFTRQSTDRWVMVNPSSELVDAMEISKLNLISSVFQEDISRRFKFTLSYDEGILEIKIPVRRISFDEAEEGLLASFKIRVNIYRDNEKIDTLEEEKTWETTEEEIIERKDYNIQIPYTLPGKGNYMLDVIVEDAKSVGFAKYRNLVKKKVR
jgi:GWxTD domain-containing protein